MMLLCAFSISTPTIPNSWLPITRRSSRKSLRCSSDLASTSGSVSDFYGVFHNKVLLSAAISAAIGQFSKPFTSSLLYGKQFNWRAAIEAGGFPSTHSSAAVASATSLLLERGFSDSVFGLAVVYASLVMYDAQGVRREVGNHSRALNRLVTSRASPKELPEISNSTQKKEKSSDGSNMDCDAAGNGSLLKESIGHTQVEVVAGALLGFFVSLAVFPALTS